MRLNPLMEVIGIIPAIMGMWIPASAQRSRKSRKSDRKSTRLNSSHSQISYAVFCLKKKKMLRAISGVVTQTVIILVLTSALCVYPATVPVGSLIVIFTVAFFALGCSGISLALSLKT